VKTSNLTLVEVILNIQLALKNTTSEGKFKIVGFGGNRKYVLYLGFIIKKVVVHRIPPYLNLL
jgi:hypothetical protein